MSQLMFVVGAGVIFISLLGVAAKAVDNTGWFAEHNSETSFVAAFWHLFRYNLKFTWAKYGLICGVVVVLTGAILELV